MGRKRGTEQQYKIIDALVEYPTKSRQEIADIVGCHITTIDKIKADAELKRRYLQRCNEKISDLVPLAIMRLHKLIKSDTTQSAVHVAAVREILDRSHLRELLEHVEKDIKITVTYE